MQATISIKANKLLLHEKEHYHVFFYLSVNVLQIARTNQDKNQIELLEEYNTYEKNLNKSQLESIFSKDWIKNASSRTLAIASKKSMLIPAMLFEEKEQLHYFEQMYFLDNDEYLMHQNLEELQLVDLFIMKTKTFHLLKQTFGIDTIKHCNANLLKNYTKILRNEKQVNLFLQLNEKNAWLSLFNNKKLQWHQEYEINGSMDLLYFTLNALNKFNIAPSDVFINILGEQYDYQPEIEQFKKENIEARCIARIKHLNYPDELFHFPSHRFFTLFSQIA